MATAGTTGLEIVNLEHAHYECVYPHCGGICCRNGRPAVEDDERERIAAHLPKFLPLLRPEVQRHLQSKSFYTQRKKEGLPMLAVVDQWCVFHHEGCVLHQVGAEEGDRAKYKPWRCTMFPLDRRPDGTWYVRQWGLDGEAWDLFCLNPAESSKSAADTLSFEAGQIAEVERKYFSGEAS